MEHYKDKIIVLIYHDISPDPFIKPHYTVSPEQFKSHLEALEKYGYNIISTEDLLKFSLYDHKVPFNSVVITFDDGNESFYTYAYPLLKQYGFPATNFIKVGFVGRRNKLTWNQMREMKTYGMSFFSHTYDQHRLNEDGIPILKCPLFMEEQNRFETQSEYQNRIKADLQLAEKRIHEELGEQPKLLAFPFNGYNDTVLEIGEEIGIELFFTSKKGTNKRKQTIINRLIVGSATHSAEKLMEQLKQYHTK
ncbi:polysaccharide deacetylase family protein [Brevibacillus brevis]|uniref:Polysaccharide deacetylase family protein n=1 Tax=Brevibacillus brevis TaxID=1393 RepID=A0A517IDN7_BREBE|nr:polysaccharide deacetylase family protein [Brevibacillus brevis]QDS37003.1 polysaccharide deacetylase family protein [Brevibacillus brevis]